MTQRTDLNGVARQIEQLVERGDLYEAYRRYDRHKQETEQTPPELHYWGLLALARSGFILEAIRRFLELGLEEENGQDFRLLPARLLKEFYFQTGQRYRWMAEEALVRYNAEYLRCGDSFPGINAAFLKLVLKEASGAEAIAAEIVARSSPEPADQDRETVIPNASLYAALTHVEALFILRRETEATRLLRSILENAAEHKGAVENFLRQLDRIRQIQRLPRLRVEHPEPGTMLYFEGPPFLLPGISGNANADKCLSLSPSDFDLFRKDVDKTLKNLRPTCIAGSLGVGSELTIANSALECGIRVQALLPCKLDVFRAHFIEPYGAFWSERFDACVDHPDCTLVELTEYQPHMSETSHTHDRVREIAVGHALLLARGNSLKPRSFLVSSGLGNMTPAQNARFKALEVAVGDIPSASQPDMNLKETDSDAQRFVATVFCDVVGSSRLEDADIARVLGSLYESTAQVLNGTHGVLDRNTWGDGLFFAMSDVVAAAELALAISRWANQHLPVVEGKEVALRIACHYGAAILIHDHIRGVPSYTGSAVIKTARIEPVTPPGAVYTTQAFASRLAYEKSRDHVLEVVGEVPLAKGFGRELLYSLRHKHFSLTTRQQAIMHEALSLKAGRQLSG